MIRVERSDGAAACAALKTLGKSGLTEEQHALWHFANEAPPLDPLPQKPGKPPNFGAYKRQPVKDELTAMFGVKCAYCESVYAHVGPMDVEHFRPKGGYLDANGVLRKPGYYWLAAHWHNLLPSCVDCNRERKQFRRSSDGQLVRSKSGKANHFPLLPGTPRATCQGETALESPLLLDPCTDTPGDHLQFFADGFVAPALTEAEKATPKGRSTIDVYGLTRDVLVAQRHGLAIKIKAVMQSVFNADRNRRVYPDDPAMVEQQTAALNNLSIYFEAGEPFQAMAIAMRTAFERVRAVAARYAEAEAAFQMHKGDAEREELTVAASNIVTLRLDPLLDRDLVIELLALAKVLPEKV
jgi:uncharacterized protein (TIGR02646 family)